MRTRGHHRADHGTGHRARAVALAGLTLLAIGAGTPAQAADQPAPGSASTAAPTPRTEQRHEKSAPKPVEDLTAPQRPTLGEVSTEPGGTVRVDVLAEVGSALVVREGTEVVATAAGTGVTQTLTWRTSSGPHTFLLVATDAAGNVSDPAPVTLQVDATPPAAKNFVVKPGTDRNSRTRWAVVTEPGTTYELVVDGNTLAEGVTEGRVVRDTLPLPDGTHEVELQLRDGVGNLRTLEEPVTVDIPALWVAAKDVSAPNATERSFKVAAAPGTRGFLRIPGAGNTRFELPDGRAEVTLTVEEGSYEAPVVVVADELDRKGSTALEAFDVDLTAPSLQVETTPGAAEHGVLSAVLTAGEGDQVSWRLVTDSGLVTMSGEFVANGTDQVLERAVAEGDYDLEVTATDATGNATTEKVAAAISARPMVNPDVVPALTITLVLWALVALAVFLRRRANRLRTLAGLDGAQAVADHEEQQAAFERDNRAWEERRAQLAQLADVARGGRVEGCRVDSIGLQVGDSERVYCVVPASLVELQARDGVEVPVEVGDGHLVVSDVRMVFCGSERREWALSELEQLRHLGPDRTMMVVAHQTVTSGVVYADADIVRLYLELAMAEAKGSARSVRVMLEHGVRSHELRRPQAAAQVATMIHQPEPAEAQVTKELVLHG